MEQLLVGYFLNSMWQLLLLAAGAWLLVRTLRPGPQAQHWIWTAILPLALVLPLLTLHTANPPQATQEPAAIETPATVDLLLATHRVEIPPPVEVRAAPASPSYRDDLDPQTLDQAPIQAPTIAPTSISYTPSASLLHWPSTRELRLGPSSTCWIAGLYLATIVLALFRLLFGLWTARRVLAHAETATLNSAQSRLLDQCCARLGVPRPAVLESASAHSPMVVGFSAPSLLLPQGYAHRPAQSIHELEAVWFHELAHLRRGDSRANLICRLLALPVAYHPATWAVEQRIRQTREMLCDAIAAAEMQSPTGYARCLVALARTMQLPGTMTPQFDSAAMFDGRSLEERVMQLIETKGTNSLRTRTLRLTCATAVILAVLAAAATFHVTPTLAQSPSPAPAAVAVSQAQPAPSPTPVYADAGAAAPDDKRLDEAREQFEIGMKIASEAVTRAFNQEIRGQDNYAQREDFRRQFEDHEVESEAARKAWSDALRQSTDASVRASIEAQIHAHEAGVESAEVQKEIAEAMAKVDSPLFKKQIADAQAKINSPEFRKQMEDAKAKFNSPEFKEKMEKLNSPEFKKQMEAKAKFNSPEFKEQMKKFNSPEFKKQMAEANAKFNSPEFKKQMEYINSEEFKKRLDLQKQIVIDRSFLNLPQFQEQMEHLQATLNSPALTQNLDKLDSAELKKQLSDLNKELGQLREQLHRSREEHSAPEPAPAAAPNGR